MTPRRKTFLKISISVVVLISAGYYFFMHTNRGSSIALYAIGGWHAPLSTKFDCAHETDARVKTKFELPLAFDEETKDQLRGFWFYSYYRNCLFTRGYDFKGLPVPKSTISDSGDTALYQNSYGGFSFKVPKDAKLSKDNELDVDFDDRLLASEITISTTTFSINTLLKHDDFKTFDDLLKVYNEHPFSQRHINEFTELRSASGLRILKIIEDDQTNRLIFVTPNGYVVNIVSITPQQFEVDAIIDSMTIL